MKMRMIITEKFVIEKNNKNNNEGKNKNINNDSSIGDADYKNFQ
jgi:hypothetical protein